MVSAATSNGNGNDLAEKIATKFNLNKDEVKQVFEEEHTARRAEHEKRVSERLQKLVDEGTITAEQKTAIEAKLKELQANREEHHEEMENLSDDERKAKLEEKRTELENWAKEQGLDLSKLKGVFGGPRGHGHRGSPQS